MPTALPTVMLLMGWCWITFSLFIAALSTLFQGTATYSVISPLVLQQLLVTNVKVKLYPCCQWTVLSICLTSAVVGRSPYSLALTANWRKIECTSYLKYQVFQQYWRTLFSRSFVNLWELCFYYSRPAGYALIFLHFSARPAFPSSLMRISSCQKDC